MSNTYHRAVKLCGQSAVDKVLSDLIYSEQSRRMEAMSLDVSKNRINSINEVEAWINQFKVYPRYASRGGKKGLKKQHKDESRMMTVEDVKGKCRFTEIIIVRFCLIKHLKEFHTFARIGSMLGGKDHTTIMNGLDTFNAMIEVGDKEYIYTWNRLQEFLKQNNAEGV